LPQNKNGFRQSRIFIFK